VSLGKQDVEKVANLVAIQVEAHQTEQVAQQLNNILDLFAQMQAVNTDEIAPMAHPLEQVQPLREDKVTEQNLREKLAAVAPDFDREKGVYLVPQVIE